MHMTLKEEQLGVENVHSILCSFIIIVGLNIVSMRNLHVSLYATCSTRKTNGKGTNAFTDGGWRNWNREDALLKHVGCISSVHNAAQERYNLFVNARAMIDDLFVKVNNEDLRLYKMRLKYSLRCLQFLLHQ